MVTVLSKKQRRKARHLTHDRGGPTCSPLQNKLLNSIRQRQLRVELPSRTALHFSFASNGSPMSLAQPPVLCGPDTTLAGRRCVTLQVNTGLLRGHCRPHWWLSPPLKSLLLQFSPFALASQPMEVSAVLLLIPAFESSLLGRWIHKDVV